MDPTRVVCTVSITNKTLDTILDSILKEDYPNKESIKKLLFDLLNNSHMACEWLLRFQMGEEYPHYLKPGTQGYIPVNVLAWSQFKDAYHNASCNQHGYIPCVITSMGALQSYSPVAVRLPLVEYNGEKVQGDLNIESNQFLLKLPPAPIDPSTFDVELDI